MKTKIIRLKRLWNNIASVRDYIVKDAIDGKYNLQVTVKDQKGYMILTPENLEKRMFQTLPTKIKSKYKDTVYSLYDFSWAPNDPAHISEAEQMVKDQDALKAKEPKQESLF